MPFHVPSRSSRPLLLVLLIASLLGVPLSGCEVLAPTPTPQPVTITFSPFGSTEDFTALKNLFEERYPHITVEISSFENANADVIMAPAYMLPMLTEQTQITNLEPYVEADADFDASDLLPGALEMLRQDGAQVGIPANMDIVIAYYNQDLFDAYAVPYPQPGWSWDEFMLTTGRVSHPEHGVFGYAPVDLFLDAMSMLYSRGGWVMDDVAHPTRVTLNEPATVEALNWYASLFLTHNIAPTPDQMAALDINSVAGAVYTNKVAVWLTWLSERGGSASRQAVFPARWEMRWSALPLPVELRSGALVQMSAYFVPASSQNPEAAWRWISFLSQQLPTRYLPVRQSQLESKAFETAVGQEMADTARAALANADLLSPQMLQFMQAFEQYARAVDNVVRGRSSVQEALDQAQSIAE
jgi:multiple sugar transport system substrate-binding protein